MIRSNDSTCAPFSPADAAGAAVDGSSVGAVGAAGTTVWGWTLVSSPVLVSLTANTWLLIGVNTVFADSTVSTSRPSIFAESLKLKPTP